MESRSSVPPGNGGLRESRNFTPVRGVHLQMPAREQVFPCRNRVPSAGDRLDCEHAHDGSQRFTRVPGGRQGGRRPQRASAYGQSAVCPFRHIHDMVRKHNHKSRSNFSIGRTGRQFGVQAQCTELSPRPWTVPSLRTELSVDFRECRLRRAHLLPPVQALQGFDEGERGGGPRSGSRHDSRQCDLRSEQEERKRGRFGRRDGEGECSRGSMDPGNCMDQVYLIHKNYKIYGWFERI